MCACALPLILERGAQPNMGPATKKAMITRQRELAGVEHTYSFVDPRWANNIQVCWPCLSWG